MFIVNDWAAKYFQDILQNDVDGRAIGMQFLLPLSAVLLRTSSQYATGYYLYARLQ